MEPEQILNLTCQFTQAQHERLGLAAKATGITRSAIVRTAIAAYCNWVLDKTPHCAIGTPCLCPQTWQFAMHPPTKAALEEIATDKQPEEQSA